MNRILIVFMAGFVFSNAASGSTNTTSYKAEALLKLIRLQLDNGIDAADVKILVQTRGVGFEWDFRTIATLVRSNNATDEQLEAMEKVITESGKNAKLTEGNQRKAVETELREQNTNLDATNDSTDQVIVNNPSSTATNIGTANVQNPQNGSYPVEAEKTNGTNPPAVDPKNLTVIKYLPVFFHVGSYILNPYEIDENHIVQKGDSEASLFLELVYNKRWAWDDKRFIGAEKSSEQSWQSWGWDDFDFQGRISYTFANNDEPSASTIVGSGDVFTTPLAKIGSILPK